MSEDGLRPIFGVDAARVDSWGDPDAMNVIDDMYKHMAQISAQHGTPPKIGMMGWSMYGETTMDMQLTQEGSIGKPIPRRWWQRKQRYDGPGGRIHYSYSHGGYREDGTGWSVDRVTSDQGNFERFDRGPWQSWKGDPMPWRDWLQERVWWRLKFRAKRWVKWLRR